MTFSLPDLWLGVPFLEAVRKSGNAIMVLRLPSRLFPATLEHLKISNFGYRGSLYQCDACQREDIEIPGQVIAPILLLTLSMFKATDL